MIEADKLIANKERFISLYRENITREGADELLQYLMSPQCDFFTAPASGRYHCSYPGGLCEHSLNVYDRLISIMEREDVNGWVTECHEKKENCKYPLNETLAIVSLLHDLCKINFYKESKRNVKGEDGVWRQVPYYEIDDKLPYGHGEKSVYMITGYMRLTREEAFAIRYHMGFSGNTEDRDVSSAFQMFPLCYAVSSADMEATYYIEQ